MNPPATAPETPVRPFDPLPLETLDSFRSIVGRDAVLSEPVELQLYAYDSALDRALPRAVLLPETAAQVAALVKLCARKKIPFVARGAATNLCGGTVPLRGAVVIAPTRMKRVLSIDPRRRLAVVEPGLPNLFLKKALEPHGLYYAPDPSSQKACTIGGNIGTNAGGPHCLKYGVTSHHVLGLEVVLPDGETVWVDVGQSGPDFTGLFVGSEGTLGIVTRAALNLLPIPKSVETMLVSFPTLDDAFQAVTDIIAAGIIPATLEAMDRLTVEAVEAFVHAGYPTNAEGVLLIELDGDGSLRSQAELIRALCERNHSLEFRLARDEREREKLWEGRRGSYPAMARLAPNVLVEDGAVPRHKLPEALRRIRAIAGREGLQVSLICHAGDGNLHPQILFDERDPEQTARVKKAGAEMLKVCVDLGGTISGEHGIGMDKREAMRWLFTPETLAQFRRIKDAFDPERLANPDKLIPVAADSASPVKPAPALLPPGNILEPRDAKEAAGWLAACSAEGRPVTISSSAQGAAMGPRGIILCTRKLNRILDHDVDNFTVQAEAGIPLEVLQEVLNAKRQKVLVFEGGTLGGILSKNPVQFPRLRDQVLGMEALLADGSRARFGAKVMKNVAGYDAPKLFLGARGCLGLISTVILRTYPLDYPAEGSLHFLGEAVPLSSDLVRRVKRAFDPGGTFPPIEECLGRSPRR